MNWIEVYKIDKINDNIYQIQGNIMNIIDKAFTQVKLISKKDIYIYHNLQLQVSNKNTSCCQINKTISTSHNSPNNYLVLECILQKMNNNKFPYISNYNQEITEYINEYRHNCKNITIYVVTEINKKNKKKIQYIRLDKDDIVSIHIIINEILNSI